MDEKEILAKCIAGGMPSIAEIDFVIESNRVKGAEAEKNLLRASKNCAELAEKYQFSEERERFQMLAAYYERLYQSVQVEIKDNIQAWEDMKIYLQTTLNTEEAMEGNYKRVLEIFDEKYATKQ